MTNTEFLKGIAHELKFWKGFVKTERFLDGWVPPRKTPELNQSVHEFILRKINERENAKVLDVGSGVVSILNGTVNQARLTAADPLGELYESIFDFEKYKINPPVPVPAEEMVWDSIFDIVHMSNAIDHAQDPLDTFFNLYKSCKPGGFVILQGFQNEGTFEKWQGFHQWDIELNNDVSEGFHDRKHFGSLTITDKNGYAEEITQFSTQTVYTEKVEFEKKTWYIWIIQKS